MNKGSQDKEKAKDPKWDEAIEYTRRQLEKARKRTEQLQEAIKTYEWNRDRGFPWPTQN
jgi:hypothetical protein